MTTLWDVGWQETIPGYSFLQEDFLPGLFTPILPCRHISHGSRKVKGSMIQPKHYGQSIRCEEMPTRPESLPGTSGPPAARWQWGTGSSRNTHMVRPCYDRFPSSRDQVRVPGSVWYRLSTSLKLSPFDLPWMPQTKPKTVWLLVSQHWERGVCVANNTWATHPFIGRGVCEPCFRSASVG